MQRSFSDIENALREQIVQGTPALGARLPLRNALAAQFGTSLATMQKAVTSLEREGFVWTRAGVGTFVRPDAPHQTAFALAFPPTSEQMPTWYDRIVESAQRISASTNFRFSVYRGIGGGSGVEDTDRLSEDVMKHRLAGVFFFYVDLSQIKTSPILCEPGIVRVSEGVRRHGTEFPLVRGDWALWMDRALSRLSEQGCRKPAALIADAARNIQEEQWSSASGHPKMTFHDHWLQTPKVDLVSIRRCVRLLFDRPDRPDGLIITHADYEAGAFAGLSASGFTPGLDIPVVVHTELPGPQTSSRRITRLGFDSGDVLRAMLEQANRMMSGNAAEALTLVAPVESGLD